MPGRAVNGGVVVGKLPFHGDFVARGVSAAERQQLDAWLSASMAIAREQLASRFDEAFDCAPPWRFAWQGEQWTAGALAPSVDFTGRRFPLLVARHNLQEEQVTSAARLCEDAAADAISKRWSADELVTAIEDAAVASGSGSEATWWSEELGEAAKLHDRFPAAILSHMLAAAGVQ